MNCPSCGSTQLRLEGNGITQRYHLRCKNCRSWWLLQRGGVSESRRLATKVML